MGSVIVKNRKKDELISSYNENLSHLDNMVSQVEFFAFQIFLHSNKVDCLWLLLSSKLGVIQFRRYLKREKVAEWLYFFNDLTKIKSFNKDTLTVDELTDKLTFLIDSYMYFTTPLGNYLKKYFDDQIQSLLQRLFSLNEVHDFIEELLLAVTDIIANCFIEPFFFSKSYTHWRSMERSHAIALTKDDVISRSYFDKENEESLKDTDESLKRLISVNNPLDTVIYSISKLSEKYCSEFFDFRCEWLLNLLSIVDLLPIGFLLMKKSGNAESRGSPIIFMNKYVETRTQVSHDFTQDINPSFFQLFSSSEDQNIKELKDAHNVGNQFVDSVSVVAGNDKHTKIIIGFKPVFEKNIYVYGVSIALFGNLEVTGKEYVKKLLDILPCYLTNSDELE